MYDSIATLKQKNAPTFDEYGNEIITYTDREVYVKPRGVYSAEFYNAAQAGLKPSVTFEIAAREDYNGERLIVWQEQEYDVIRVDWTAQRDRVRLICEERVSNG